MSSIFMSEIVECVRIQLVPVPMKHDNDNNNSNDNSTDH